MNCGITKRLLAIARIMLPSHVTHACETTGPVVAETKVSGLQPHTSATYASMINSYYLALDRYDFRRQENHLTTR